MDAFCVSYTRTPVCQPPKELLDDDDMRKVFMTVLYYDTEISEIVNNCFSGDLRRFEL